MYHYPHFTDKTEAAQNETHSCSVAKPDLEADPDPEKHAFPTLDHFLSTILHITAFFKANTYTVRDSPVHSTNIHSQPAMCLATGFKTSKAGLALGPANPHTYVRSSVPKVNRSTEVLRHFQGEANNIFIMISRPYWL